MMEEAIVKNSEVEVSPEEEGFKGAYFRAILEENPTKSGRKKLRVRYTTLLNDDGSTPLTEMLDHNLIRPVPPVELYKNGDVLEEGSMVDADHKDGWWIGVVIKKSQDENKFLVYFDSPPDIIQFERNQLRPHFDWTGSKWVRPEIQELRNSEFSPGTMVEVNSMRDKEEVVWLPAMIVKEIDDEKKKRFIVKDCNQRQNSRPNATVDSCRVRPTPSLPSVEHKYKLMERVEVFRDGLGWRQGLVRGVFSDGKFMVSLEATKEESVFKHPNIRPFQTWEDGVWLNGPKVKETPFGKKKLKPKCSLSSSSVVYKPITPITPSRPTKLIIRRSLNPETVVTASGEYGKKKTVDTDVVTPVKESETLSEECGKTKASLFHKDFRGKTPQVTSSAKESVTPSPLNETDVEPVNDSTQNKMMEEEENNEEKREQEDNNSETGETNNASNAEINDTMTKEFASPEKTLEPVNDSTQNKMMEEEHNQDKREEEQNLPETDETCNASNAEINDTANEIVSSVTPSPVITATPLKEKETETHEKTLDPVNGLGTDSTQKIPEGEENNEDESRKRKREPNSSESDGSCNTSNTEINGRSKKICNNDQPLSAWIRNLSTELSPVQTPNTQSKDVMNLPFEKKSPFWKSCESMKSFKSAPQSPHFSPLSEAKEDVREWTAVGMMVTFYGLLDEVKDLKPNDASIERLQSLSDSFAELEKHGFEVEALQTQVSKMLSLKEKRVKKAEEKKGFQIMIDEEESAKRKFGEEKADMARLILMLKKAEATAKEKEEASEKKVVEMKLTAEMIDQEIEDIDLEFEKIVSSPWYNNN